MGANTFNMKELTAAVGVERLTVLRWVKKGLPVMREPGRRGGRPRLVFDRETTLAWIAANGKITAGRKAAAMSSGGGSPGAEPEPEQAAPAQPAAKQYPIDGELARQPGLLGALERVKRQEILTAVALERAKREQNANLIVVLSDRHLQESKTIAKLEESALSFRQRIGELGPRSEMQNVFERVIITIKNAVLGLPSGLIPQLMPFLSDADRAHEVRTIIDKAARDCLRSISQPDS